MGYINLKLEGANDIHKSLGYIEDLPGLAKQALQAGADVLLPKLKSAAPVGPGGGKHIRDRLDAKVSLRTAYVGAWYDYTPVQTLEDGTKSRKQEDPPVAYYVEYGHGGPHPAPAHPFMKPTADEAADEVMQAIADTIDSYLNF